MWDATQLPDSHIARTHMHLTPTQLIVHVPTNLIDCLDVLMRLTLNCTPCADVLQVVSLASHQACAYQCENLNC